uniref:Palmitoyltransferase n=1 Tax=Globodera pallida TaxID=36090 RepID=A0A183CQF7_GLOPA
MLFLFWNYMVLRYMYLACMLGPGFSKIGWHPEEDEDWKYFRYCYRCLAFKAPRVHHCSRCRRCVLLMDHHCPWINNCVGQRNQIYFVKFLFFAIVGSAHAAIVLTSCLYKVIFAFMLLSNSENEQQRQHLQHLPELPIASIYLFICSVLAVGLAYGVVIAVGILLIVQLRSVYLDRTGIESLKNK